MALTLTAVSPGSLTLTARPAYSALYPSSTTYPDSTTYPGAGISFTAASAGTLTLTAA